MRTDTIRMAALTVTAALALASCGSKKDETPNYLGPRALEAQKAAAAHPTARTAPQGTAAGVAEPDGLHVGTKIRWIEADGPNGAKAMLGTESFGITAFEADQQDPTHFLVLLYKGSCQVGWKAPAKAGLLNTMTNKDDKAHDVPAPPLPWLEASLARTCPGGPPVPAMIMADHEAMAFMMTRKP